MTRGIRNAFVWINLLGGIAVLGSYAWGFAFRPDAASALWGGVPESLRPVYTVNMLLAAAGYFFFTPWVLRLRPDALAGAAPLGPGLFPALYLLILLPSALWLPLTVAHVEQPSPALWAAIRGVLFAVGAGSVGLLAAIAALRAAPRGRRLALAGLVPFCFQTAVLDALVWPAYFPGKG